MSYNDETLPNTLPKGDPYLKKIQKLYQSCDTSPELC